MHANVAPEEFRAELSEMRPVVAQLLWNRGVRTRGEANVFLGPDWSRDAHAPSLFLNMQRAVCRVFGALEGGERIVVHGDYDADGVCGSAVLLSALRDICRACAFDETKLTSFLPDREKDGYGVSVATVERLCGEGGARLLITVDCGISNKPAIDRARGLGADTIVCDHHAMPSELPEEAILIHPLVPGETYPNKSLCGTGVAFKLASALIQEARRRGAAFPDGHEKWLLDLVAVATVTDVMPLAGENRLLETYGLVVLNKTRRPGLRALVEVAGAALGSIDTETIGFRIGPRLNAAGRMRHAGAALETMLEEDPTRAAERAAELDAANADRQRASDAMYRAALERIGNAEDTPLIVAVGEGWSPGLVGLVAGKVASKFGKPTYVVGVDAEGKHVGSGRGVHGFDVTDCMRAASEHLDKFGGHPQACGFSVTGADRFARALDAMRAYASAALAGRDLAPLVRVDADIDLADIGWELLSDIDRLAPFGEGNPRPVFAARGATVAGAAQMGADGKHLRLTLASSTGRTQKAVGFGFGHLAPTLKLGARVDVAFELAVNEWNGNREIQARVIDIKNA